MPQVCMNIEQETQDIALFDSLWASTYNSCHMIADVIQINDEYIPNKSNLR